MVIYLQIHTILWTDGRITSAISWTYVALMILGRQKCTQLSH